MLIHASSKTVVRKLTRTDVNFCLDLLLLVLFLAVCGLSVILEFDFPVGPQADGWLLWSHRYGEWSRIRFILRATMAAAVVLHVMLHWSWVCGVIASRLGTKKAGAATHDDPSRTLWGIGLLIVVCNLVGLIVAAAAITIQAPVITRYRNRNSNLRTQFLRILRRAGVEPWPRLFHNLRASRQTELTDFLPAHVVSDWCGNSPQIAECHYLQTVEAHMQRAIGEPLV